MVNQNTPGTGKSRPRRAAATVATGKMGRFRDRQISEDMRSPPPKRRRPLQVRNESSDYEMDDASPSESDSEASQMEFTPPSRRSKTTGKEVAIGSSPVSRASRSSPKVAPRRLASTGPRPETAPIVQELGSSPGSHAASTGLGQPEPSTSADPRPSQAVIKAMRLPKKRRARTDKPKDDSVMELDNTSFMELWKGAIDKAAYENCQEKLKNNVD